MALEEKYNYRDVEKKWQKKWREADLYRVVPDPTKPKFYGLEFFPYPSGSGLSVGHFKNYAPNDAFLRYKSMKGYNVLHPMGWDAFGQPAENEAFKWKRHPGPMVREYADTYKRQFDLVGMSYDWDREINSSDPSYYRWTQWIFLKLFERGLAERKNAPVNWCPKDKTVLANEEVHDGRCWRCGTLVEKKLMPQWYMKITEYADRLLADLDTIDWPEGIKLMQRDWIGKSIGAEVDFYSSPNRGSRGNSEASKITVFTTRPDTLWGATFMVLAPEHSLVAALTTPEQKAAVDEYIARASKASEMDRKAEGRDKTGVFTGAYATNPVNGDQIPIWIADYVLMGYGTGAIMAVPAHDQRDFEFARKFGLRVVPVYQVTGAEVDGDTMTEAVADKGELTNSGHFNGMAYNKDTVRVVALWLEEQGFGKPSITYKLRDWLISRQRFWGCPIPIVHCPVHGEVPVPLDQLPVRLPDVESYESSGTGESPLATIPKFVNTICPICGGPARRETDTMGGFACSSWYFLRFADPHNDKEPFDRAAVDYWLPVDMYVGGAEHAVMHLLYARFWTKVLYDAGLVGFVEPFSRLRNQGMMLAYTPGVMNVSEDGGISEWKALKPEEVPKYSEDEIVWRWAKMSKSSGNVVTPDDAAERFGSDALRVYEGFVAPFEETVQWKEETIFGAARFLGRVWRLVGQVGEGWNRSWKDRLDSLTPKEKNLRRKTHQTILKVADDIENFRFNTAVAALMEWVNVCYEILNELPSSHSLTGEGAGGEVQRSAALDEAVEMLVLTIAPFAPHMADEMWTEGLGQTGFLYRHPWPEADPNVAKNDEITLVVQVNGKVRDKLTAPADADNETLKSMALASDRLAEFTAGKSIKNVIVVPGRLVNIVVA